MALPILRGLLRGFVQSLFDEGVVNDQFSRIQSLKSNEDPECAVRLINTYLLDVETILSEMTSHSDLPGVDFSKLASMTRTIEEKSSLLVQVQMFALQTVAECWSAKHWAFKQSDMSLISNYLEIPFNYAHHMHGYDAEDVPSVMLEYLHVLATELDSDNPSLNGHIGAEHVRFACADLIQACDRMQKQNFLQALGWVKNEFNHTRKKLDSFIQMERRIFRAEGKEVE